MAQCSAQTTKNEPCRAHALRGTDPPLCPHHAGVRRPAKFGPDAVDRIVSVLRAGNYPQTAAAAAGISLETFYAWLRRGDPDRADPADAPYREFRERVERARGEGEARNVALVAQAAATSWQAAAWLLERQYPERWARPSQRGDLTRPDDPDRDPAEDPLDALDADIVELAPRRRARKRA
ncbi:MAG TPA: hypothetical protein VGJ32_16490 [Solirubrobacteraceae bacterium]|jgi:hypothetical protein